MINQLIKKLKTTFENFDKKIITILKYGFKFCFLVSILASLILVTYLFFLHNTIIFQIGLTVFELSLCFAAEFIASAITIDTICKQLG